MVEIEKATLKDVERLTEIQMRTFEDDNSGSPRRRTSRFYWTVRSSAESSSSIWDKGAMR